MKNKELFHKSVNILVDAYFNDTLKHGYCHACAVGNIINHYRPFTQKEIGALNADQGYREGWSTVFCTFNANIGKPHQEKSPHEYKGVAKAQIDSTGYKWQELAKIEYAFETARNVKNDSDTNMFNGLMAVVDALIEIHEGNEEENVNAKNLFDKAKNPIKELEKI